MKNTGYTLIELVISIGILGIVGGIVLATIFTAANTSNKSREIETVRQNGNYAITQIEKLLRFAETFDGVSTDGNTFQSCQGATGTQTFIKFSTFNADPAQKAKILGCPYLPISGGKQNISLQNVGTTTWSDFLNTTQVTLNSCSLICTISADNQITIEASFDLQGASPSVRGNIPSIPFRTSVTLRNSR